LTINATIPSKDEAKSKSRRKSPKATLELRAKIKELAKEGKTPTQISQILGVSKYTAYEHINYLLDHGEIDKNQTRYAKVDPLEEKKWIRVIQRVHDELPFYQNQGLVPTVRKMYYRLLVLYEKDKTFLLTKSKTSYDQFAKYTAEARRGVDSTFTIKTKMPRLPIDCFVDDGRTTIGETDMDEPEEPTPAEPPDDPIEVARHAIKYCKKQILEYDGSRTEGDEGVNPGKWYKQPIYCEVLCESNTIQPDLLKFQRDRSVKVSSVRGFKSCSFMYQYCKRLKEIAEMNSHIKKS
jgi:DNA-binding CsgD family transcriptional regulator